MKVCEKVKEKEFQADTTKKAYRKACQWYASNVIAINNGRNIQMEIQKVGISKVKLVLYVCAEEGEIQQAHCEICKEMSSAFYINERKHACDSCKMVPYRNRLRQRIEAIKNGLKGVVL